MADDTTKVASSLTVTMLPRELIDAIVAQLDKSGLSRCTLLSKSWSISARPLLFRSIVIHPHADRRNPNAHCRCIGSHDIEAFQDFLDVPASSSVSLFIENLQFKGHMTREYDTYELSARQVHSIISKLPALKTLRIIEVDLKYSQDPVNWGVPRPLEKLSLRAVTMEVPGWVQDITGGAEVEDITDVPSQCCFVQLVNLFGSVEILEIGDVYFITPRGRLTRMIWVYCSGVGWPDFSSKTAGEISSTFKVQKFVSHMSRSRPQQDVLTLLRMSHSLDLVTILNVFELGSVQSELLQSIGP